MAATLVEGMQTRLPHQTSDAMLATLDPLREHLCVNSWASIDAPPLLKSLANLFRQPLILQPFDGWVPACAKRSSRFLRPKALDTSFSLDTLCGALQ